MILQLDVKPDGTASPDGVTVVQGLGMGLDEKAIEGGKAVDIQARIQGWEADGDNDAGECSGGISFVTWQRLHALSPFPTALWRCVSVQRFEAHTPGCSEKCNDGEE